MILVTPAPSTFGAGVNFCYTTYMTTSGGKRVFSFVVLLIIAGLLGYFVYILREEKKALQGQVAGLETKLRATEKDLAEMVHNSASLLDALTAEQQKSGFLQEQASSFAAAVQRLTGTVTTLEKLRNTDPELLIKYSKVYFLNEHYTPQKLAVIPATEVRTPAEEEYFLAPALPYLENLLKEAKAAGAELKVVSAYRSFETQRDLKSAYKVTYGSGANKFAAEQGYSEHQLGTAIDVTAPSLGATFEKIDTTTAYFWLTENAHKYGFVLSYPKGNSYYIYEPWHWRFVGVELATRLKNEKKNFYDMDQREINEYLVKIFD